MSFATNMKVFEGNIVSLGFKGDDNPVKELKDNNHVLNFSVAVNNRRGKDADGEWVDIEPAEFVRCTAWGDTAVNIGKLKPGTPLILVGDMRAKDGYTDKNGEKHGPSEFLNVQSAGVSIMRYGATSEFKKGGGSGKASSGTSKVSSKKPDNDPVGDLNFGFDEDDDDDDLPF